MPDLSQSQLNELVTISEQEIANLSYEAAMQKLEMVVEALEQEATPLEIGLKLHQTGIALTKKCEKSLDAAEEMMLQLKGEAEKVIESEFDPEKDGR